MLGASAGAKNKSGAAISLSENLVLRIPESSDITIAGLGKLGSSELSGFEKKLAQAAKEAEREEQLFAEQASKEEAELMQQMREVGEMSEDSAREIVAQDSRAREE